MIEKFSINDFEKIYKIMENSFPLTEFRPKHEQLALFDNANYSVHGIRENGEIITIAAVWNFESIMFIEHLATAIEKRNQGLGKELLNELINSTDKTVCLEVDPPENELTRRRIAFYERCGMHFNSYPYIQPSITKGKKPIPLFIMTSRSEIDEDKFQFIKQLLYKYVYKTEQPI